MSRSIFTVPQAAPGGYGMIRYTGPNNIKAFLDELAQNDGAGYIDDVIFFYKKAD